MASNRLTFADERIYRCLYILVFELQIWYFLSKCTMQDNEFKYMNPESGMNLWKFKISVQTWPN